MVSARSLVVSALCRMESDRAYSNLLWNRLLRESGLECKDHAFATALFYGVLERRVTLDYRLNRLSKVPVRKMDPVTKQALRCGMYQICYMQKVPVSAAVNESVKLVKQSREQRNAGFVNAVLRSALRDMPSLPEGNSLLALSVRYSCPQPLVNELLRNWPMDTVTAILSASLGPAPVYLHTVPFRCSDDAFLKAASDDGLTAIKTDLPHVFTCPGLPDLTKLSVFCQGLCYAQDLSCTMAVEALGPKPGERLLDLCAAPGGKSFTAATLMENRGQILSFDLYESRVPLIKAGAQRLGLSIIEAGVGDASVYRPGLGTFDAVICDVPCSGFGVMRRKPEIKDKSTDDFGELETLQKAILACAGRYCREGGRILYSTCTLRHDENDKIVEAFLADYPKYSCLSQRTVFPSSDGGDGFYYAILAHNGR